MAKSCEVCRKDAGAIPLNEQHWLTCTPRYDPISDQICSTCRKEFQTKARTVICVLDAKLTNGALKFPLVDQDDKFHRRCMNLLRLLRGESEVGQNIWRKVCCITIQSLTRILDHAQSALDFALQNGLSDLTTEGLKEVTNLARRKWCSTEGCCLPIVAIGSHEDRKAFVCASHHRAVGPNRAEHTAKKRRIQQKKNTTRWDINLGTNRKPATDYHLSMFDLEVAIATLWYTQRNDRKSQTTTGGGPDNGNSQVKCLVPNVCDSFIALMLTMKGNSANLEDLGTYLKLVEELNTHRPRFGLEPLGMRRNPGVGHADVKLEMELLSEAGFVDVLPSQEEVDKLLAEIMDI